MLLRNGHIIRRAVPSNYCIGKKYLSKLVFHPSHGFKKSSSLKANPETMMQTARRCKGKKTMKPGSSYQ